MAWQRINIEIPEDLGPSQRLELADLIIEHIVDRTDRGLDKDGKRFPKYSSKSNYSPNYVRSLDFKNANKSNSKINLQLSGDMLAALELISHRAGSLIIGYQNGTEENDKAEGNILGSYGRSPNPSLARDFLGLQSAKLRELIRAVDDGT